MIDQTTRSIQVDVAVTEQVPGLALAVVGAEGIRAVSSAGFADLDARTGASLEMVCPWFSMTKVVTATAAMRLAERSILDLDEPLLPLVPALQHLQPVTLASRITARHLMSHSGGLANPIPIRWIHSADAPGPDLDRWLDSLLAKNRRLRFQPGERSSYSNLGTLVLGSALARVTGMPFAELIRHEVLDPLQMAHTGFSYSAELRRRAATGYHPRWSPMRLLLPRWVIGKATGRWVSLRPALLDGAPYGGLVGSVADASRFVQMHLRDGELDGLRVLTPDSTEAMREVRVLGRSHDLGLGWFRPSKMRTAQPPFVEHLGGGAGFFNTMRIYPTRGVGIVVMGNATSYDIDSIARVALAYCS